MPSLHFVAVAVLASLSMAHAFRIHFHNNCPYTVWPAVGKAPNGQPDNSVHFGTRLNSGAGVSFGVADSERGIRAWGRTGCDVNGANCKTGACTGGQTCNDAGITSHALLSEYGAGNDGREYWDLSYVGGIINIPTRLTGPDGQSVQCRPSNCPRDQAFKDPEDFHAVRSSAAGGTYTHLFCP